MDQNEFSHASLPSVSPWGFCWENQNPASCSCSEAVREPGTWTRPLDLHISHTELVVCGQQRYLNRVRTTRINDSGFPNSHIWVPVKTVYHLITKVVSCQKTGPAYIYYIWGFEENFTKWLQELALVFSILGYNYPWNWVKYNKPLRFMLANMDLLDSCFWELFWRTVFFKQEEHIVVLQKKTRNQTYFPFFSCSHFSKQKTIFRKCKQRHNPYF